ncbi:hypothetical protein [Lysobacter gummosus]|uniref:hypothetical protein n=1 Tax=Lysobacter gummosus TaxID=262324 RepID=UPI0036363736
MQRSVPRRAASGKPGRTLARVIPDRARKRKRRRPKAAPFRCVAQAALQLRDGSDAPPRAPINRPGSAAKRCHRPRWC